MDITGDTSGLDSVWLMFEPSLLQTCLLLLPKHPDQWHVMSWRRQTHEDSGTQQIQSSPVGCFQGPDMERCTFFWSLLHPSASFTPSALRSLLLCSYCISGSLLWLCLWGQHIKYIRGTSCGSCHFEIPFLCTCVCFCKFCCTSPVCLIYSACYAEGTFSHVFVRSYSPEDVKHPTLSLSTNPGTERTNPNMHAHCVF